MCTERSNLPEGRQNTIYGHVNSFANNWKIFKRRAITYEQEYDDGSTETCTGTITGVKINKVYIKLLGKDVSGSLVLFMFISSEDT